MHNLQLNEEQTMILDTVRKFVTDVAGPKALDTDEHSQFAREQFDGIGELGLYGAAVSEDAGGAGLGLVSLVVALEELGKGCTSTGRLFLTQAGVVAMALEGLDGAADAFEQVLMGSEVASYVGPEHGVAWNGSALEGTAEVVTGAGEAGVFVVAAHDADGNAVLCVAQKDAVTVEGVAALGFRATAPAKVSFGGSAATAVATGDEAKNAIARAALVTRVGGAALAAGSAFASVELGRSHTSQRIAFGKPLLRQQAVLHKLVEGRRRAEAAKHLAMHAARLADAGEDATAIAEMAFLTGVDAALHAADEGIQVHGGYGFTTEYHVERHYRDAKTLEVLDGGTTALRDALGQRTLAGV